MRRRIAMVSVWRLRRLPTCEEQMGDVTKAALAQKRQLQLQLPWKIAV